MYLSNKKSTINFEIKIKIDSRNNLHFLNKEKKFYEDYHFF
jgi:hypothetical protein